MYMCEGMVKMYMCDEDMVKMYMYDEGMGKCTCVMKAW